MDGKKTENYTYVLRCADGSLYTGWTNDLAKRVAAHNAGTGAKYTKSHGPVKLVYFEISDTKEEAMRRECRIKQLSKAQKEKLIEGFLLPEEYREPDSGKQKAGQKTGGRQMGEKPKKYVLYETENFTVTTNLLRPHIDREDGGHLMVDSKEYFTDRTEFPPALAVEAMRLSIIAGKALTKAMRERGVDVQRINYQENGNWAFRNGGSYPPYFHIHLYCRTPQSKEQPWGQALNFPDPDTGYYDHLKPLNEDDLALIRKYIREYDESPDHAPEKYKL